MKITSFPPVIPAEPTVLILGSMPGVRSLQQNQYYAHPQNSFWRMMGRLCGAAPELDYAGRLLRLQQSGIALWDVLQHCEREGSLDASIVAHTEVPNDLPELLHSLPSIRAVAFNGKKAEQAFKRHCLPLLEVALCQSLDFIALPSTSPAHAGLDLAAKWQAWQVLQRYLQGEPVRQELMVTE